MARLAYLMRYGSFLARLVHSNEKACLHSMELTVLSVRIIHASLLRLFSWSLNVLQLLGLRLSALLSIATLRSI